MIAAAHTGYVSATGVAEVDDLLTRGGLMGMMETVALIICATLRERGAREGTVLGSRVTGSPSASDASSAPRLR